MKTLQEIQEFNRRKIICAVNGTENYEEALKIEKNKNVGAISFCKNCKEFISIGNFLDRVLLALDFYDIGYIASSSDKILTITIGKVYNNLPKKIVFDWNLTKTTLEEQSEETQRAIHKLLGGENE